MSDEASDDALGVAEAKSRFSELIDRVEKGERFVVSRRGKPAVALVPPDQAIPSRPRPIGLVAVAGALADWAELAQVVEEVYAARRRARDRTAPKLD